MYKRVLFLKLFAESRPLSFDLLVLSSSYFVVVKCVKKEVFLLKITDSRRDGVGCLAKTTINSVRQAVC